RRCQALRKRLRFWPLLLLSLLLRELRYLPSSTEVLACVVSSTPATFEALDPALTLVSGIAELPVILVNPILINSFEAPVLYVARADHDSIDASQIAELPEAPIDPTI
ncbi:unnamed protein product, partial [Ilex paraguariensis]